MCVGGRGTLAAPPGTGGSFGIALAANGSGGRAVFGGDGTTD